MSKRVLKAAAVLVLSTLSALAVAADPPARVGRLALTQGQVSIGADIGAEMNPAQLNWPVTTGNMIVASPGARTELRIGSTSIRLDGDSSLEVLALDDDNIRLRLHYGSASVRILNADVTRGFELTTPQGRVRLAQPGRVRVDTERVRDTMAVSVFDGAAQVDGAGSQLTVRAGKRALVTDDDVRTDLAVLDDFDNWSASRDKLEDKVRSERYVSTEMTGYEDLDRYGSWRVDNEYGALWTPSVGADWVPYRDGSWTWLEPWGWTWVDNAPWGYAPFHYGRWVYVNRRWAWAPGTRAERLVWAPALVGWVGGAGWNVTFRDHHRGPGLGWYPLSPHDRFVPHYRAPEEHLRWLNHHVRDDHRGRGRDYRPQGLTVVPQDRFNKPGRVSVPRAPIATVPPVLVHNAPAGTPPTPVLPPRPARGPLIDRDHDGKPDRFQRFDRNRLDTAQAERDGFVRHRPQPQPNPGAVQVQTPAPGQVPMPAPAQPQPVVSPTPHQPAQPQPIVSPTPHVAPTPQPLTATTPSARIVTPTPSTPTPGWQRSERRDWDEGRRRDQDGMRRDRDDMRRDWRDQDDARRERRSGPPSAPPAPVQPPAVMPTPVQPAAVMLTPQPERHRGGDWEQRREAAPAPRVAPPPAPVAAPAPISAPAPMPAPAPVMARPAAPAAAQAREDRREERKSRFDERKHDR